MYSEQHTTLDRSLYELDDCILDNVEEEKDLGIIVTSKSNWEH